MSTYVVKTINKLQEIGSRIRWGLASPSGASKLGNEVAVCLLPRSCRLLKCADRCARSPYGLYGGDDPSAELALLSLEGREQPLHAFRQLRCSVTENKPR